ncbi:DUF3017 domain-containing protein [Corynebacterium poyangense]|uniref:DUF3017 domain-containing protein n=1 Tax=Corynebacterium poyangense TaxID=2684405 RepID=A0A7H0SMD0_9CORY|nr:DUF3017 domain-containing protein [Corynebacterium poyangense]MBZ8176806.1 DUF3017 domain-containing protein [Corynebacterium poyangense]QNQ89705.1 DUF3017 domain-containing protein [Corynebacterium poyangense]
MRLKPIPPGLSLDNPHDRKLPPSRVPRAIQYLGIALFLLGIALASVFALSDHWRRATFTLGASMLWLAVLRLGCDSRNLGVLSVRSRKFDTAFCCCFGGAMVFLSASVDALGS